MRTVYAIQLDIRRTTDEEAAAAMRGVEDLTRRWIVDRYVQKWNRPLSLQPGGCDTTPLPDHRIRISALDFDRGDLVSVDWDHPDDGDESLRWSTSCIVARDGRDVQIVVALRLGSARFEVRPFRFAFGRPRVVTEIIRAFPCSIGGRLLPTRTRSLTAEFVDNFVEKELLDPQRALPVIVLSATGDPERPVIAGANLQEALLGHAEVVTLADRWAAYRLTHELGRELSCFNGFARLYWPGLRLEADPRSAPLFSPGLLGGPDFLGRSFSDRTFERLAAIAAARLVEGPVIRAARQATDARRTLQIEALRREVDAGRSTAEEEKELATFAIQENKALATENDSLKQRVQTLEADLAQANRNLEDTWRYREEAGADDSAELPSDEEVEPGSVLEALAEAERRFGDALMVYPSARDAAADSRFARPKQVYEALEAIAEIGRQYFARKREGPPMGPWERLFGDRGFKYAATESEQTRARYRREREFTCDGRKVFMQKHLTLGGGDRENCLQIFVEIDDGNRRIGIGWCGQHLPYASQRT